ncbi:MAG TPA: prolyl aminopeptidase, partial [Rhodospirillales bacterium]|nr:prolyl aminopeptidase [Rhodospirillales bacterium]
TRWETVTSSLLSDEDRLSASDDDAFALAFARIECHYIVNRGFFYREDQLLAGVDAIRHIPAVIIQGRYDVVCPLMTAWELATAWPEAEFTIAADAGHAYTEPGTLNALISATGRFRK